MCLHIILNLSSKVCLGPSLPDTGPKIPDPESGCKPFALCSFLSKFSQSAFRFTRIKLEVTNSIFFFLVVVFLFFFFFFFYGCTHSIWKFPGQRLNQSCSCQPTPQQRRIQATSVTYTTVPGNTRSLTPPSEARDQTCELLETVSSP